MNHRRLREDSEDEVAHAAADSHHHNDEMLTKAAASVLLQGLAVATTNEKKKNASPQNGTAAQTKRDVVAGITETQNQATGGATITRTKRSSSSSKKKKRTNEDCSPSASSAPGTENKKKRKEEKTSDREEEDDADTASQSQPQPQLLLPEQSDPPVRFRDYQNDIWMDKFRVFLEFKRQHGHVLVPHAYHQDNDPAVCVTQRGGREDCKHSSLSQWVKRQRYQYKLLQEGKRSTLTPDRVRLLEAEGFIWNSHDQSWAEKLQELSDFAKEFGNCNVPSNFTANPQLAVWVKRQRRQYKFLCQSQPSSMTQERIQQLEAMGFVWNCRARGSKGKGSNKPKTAAALKSPVLSAKSVARAAKKSSEINSSLSSDTQTSTGLMGSVAAAGIPLRRGSIVIPSLASPTERRPSASNSAITSFLRNPTEPTSMSAMKFGPSSFGDSTDTLLRRSLMTGVGAGAGAGTTGDASGGDPSAIIKALMPLMLERQRQRQQQVQGQAQAILLGARLSLGQRDIPLDRSSTESTSSLLNSLLRSSSPSPEAVLLARQQLIQQRQEQLAFLRLQQQPSQAAGSAADTGPLFNLLNASWSSATTSTSQQSRTSSLLLQRQLLLSQLREQKGQEQQQQQRQQQVSSMNPLLQELWLQQAQLQQRRAASAEGGGPGSSALSETVAEAKEGNL